MFEALPPELANLPPPWLLPGCGVCGAVISAIGYNSCEVHGVVELAFFCPTHYQRQRLLERVFGSQN